MLRTSRRIRRGRRLVKAAMGFSFGLVVRFFLLACLLACLRAGDRVGRRVGLDKFGWERTRVACAGGGRNSAVLGEQTMAAEAQGPSLCE